MKLSDPVNWFLGRRNYFWLQTAPPIEILYGTITDISNREIYTIGSGIFIPYIPFGKDVTKILEKRYPNISENGVKLQKALVNLLYHNYPQFLQKNFGLNDHYLCL